jgi:hypothetical protein
LFAAPGALARGAERHAGSTVRGLNAGQLVLHDRMRKLWEDHITWTRLAIVSFAAGQPDFDATAARLLKNQADIGNAIKPYYGAKAGNRLTALLMDHIKGAIAVLQAAKSGDATAIDAAKTAWYANADQIARFLSTANPRHWPFKAVDAMMRAHLDETLKEASDRLAGNFGADVADYEAVHHHILLMADALSNGIIAQFPQKFR